MADDYQERDGTAGRHQTARSLAEKAIRAQARGDGDEADALFAEANRIDPEAVANALSEGVTDRVQGEATEPQDDAEIAAMSRTVEPGSDAPSRSGIGGRGSGADNEAT